ncbi:MAG: hypothetical protein KKC80_03485, partial [Candidatus Margulisbacteria bacterium]|nr:hypothetical protein [Candidatus Margulisiibacteriota bacterium]
MITIKLIFTVLVPLLLGYSATSVMIREKISFLERGALAWGIGLGLLGIEMFAMSLLGITLNLRNVLIPTVSLTALLIIYAYYFKTLSFGLETIPFFLSNLVGQINKRHSWQFYFEKVIIILIGLT